MHKSLIVVISCALLALPVTSAWGQGRNGVGVRNPGGGLGTVGQTRATHNFRQNTYGLGSLGNAPGTGTSVLRSTISSSPFTLRSNINAMGASPLRSSITQETQASRAGGLGAPLRTPGIGATPLRRPGTMAGGYPDLTGTDTAGGIFGSAAARSAILSANPALGAARNYLHSVGGTDLMAETSRTKVISSLVPSDSSVYSTLLREGEKQFRMGEFADAYSYFERASYIAPHAPETLLSLTHARFATSRLSYMTASHYLQLTLKYLPELPLIPVNPKLFYGQGPDSAARYVEHIDALEKHLIKSHDDLDALLLLAYYRWFANRPDDAKIALAKALKVAIEDEDARVTEAVDTFWAAMVRSGKMSGALLSVRPKAIPLIPPMTDEGPTPSP